MTKPPDPSKALGAARVLSCAFVDGCEFRGSSLLVDGAPLGPVRCLAITKPFGSSEVELLRCDADWCLLGVSAHESIAAARSRAEREYRGSTVLWSDTHSSEEESRAQRLPGEEEGRWEDAVSRWPPKPEAGSRTPDAALITDD